MTDSYTVDFDMKPRLLCDHLERTYSKTGKSICPQCDTCFSDNGDDIEKRLQEFAKKLEQLQQDLPPEFARVIDDNWEGY